MHWTTLNWNCPPRKKIKRRISEPLGNTKRFSSKWFRSQTIVQQHNSHPSWAERGMSDRVKPLKPLSRLPGFHGFYRRETNNYPLHLLHELPRSNCYSRSQININLALRYHCPLTKWWCLWQHCSNAICWSKSTLSLKVTEKKCPLWIWCKLVVQQQWEISSSWASLSRGTL